MDWKKPPLSGYLKKKSSEWGVTEIKDTIYRFKLYISIISLMNGVESRNYPVLKTKQIWCTLRHKVRVHVHWKLAVQLLSNKHLFGKIHQLAVTGRPSSWLVSCLKIVNLNKTSETGNEGEFVTSQKMFNDH